MTNERPRLSIDLDVGQKEKLTALFPWGTQRLVLCRIIDVTIKFIQTNGLGVSMDALLNNKVKLVINTPNESSEPGEEHF